MKINLNREITLLEKNFYHQLSLNLHEFSKPSVSDNSFRVDNWVINFPYNYCYFKQEPVAIELIRKLALINSILGQFYFREDQVLDEYHISPLEYKKHLVALCESRIFRNLAVGQLIYLCGEKIYTYLYEYEKKYYNALILEKTPGMNHSGTMLKHQNLISLGHKVIPICITFAGFCLIEGVPDKIPACEKMVINYHIAHQLYDDLKDARHDIQKPDRSYLLNAISRTADGNLRVAENIIDTMRYSGIEQKIYNVMTHYLSISQKYAVQLRFHLFQNQIEKLRRMAKIKE